jgi:hypothetical protein
MKQRAERVRTRTSASPASPDEHVSGEAFDVSAFARFLPASSLALETAI